MSTDSNVTALFANSYLTRHLSQQDQHALRVAIVQVNNEIWDERLGIRVRSDKLKRLMNRIVARAGRNGDEEEDLRKWRKRVLVLFAQAGETDFAADHILDYLEGVQVRVEKGEIVEREVSRPYPSLEPFE